MWNLFMIITTFYQFMFGANVSAIKALIMALSFNVIGIIYIISGIAIYCGSNWGRTLYLIVAPISLFINLYFGYKRLGVDNIYDRIPSIIITVLFVVLLLNKSSIEYFRRCANLS